MIRRAISAAETVAADLLVAVMIWFRALTITAGSAIAVLVLLAGVAYAWSPDEAAAAARYDGEEGPWVEQRSTCHALKVTLAAAARGGDSFRIVSDGDLVWPEGTDLDDEAVREAGWVAYGEPVTVELAPGVSAEISFWDVDQGGWSDRELAGVQWPWVINWTDPLVCDPKPTVTFVDQCDGSVEVTIRNATGHDRLIRISGGGLHPELIWVSSGTEAHTVRWPAAHAGKVTVELQWGSVWKAVGEHHWTGSYGYTCPTPSPTPSETPVPGETPGPGETSSPQPTATLAGNGGTSLPDTSSGIRAVAWLGGGGALLFLLGVASLVLTRGSRRRTRT